jgi:hypothetical protein
MGSSNWTGGGWGASSWPSCRSWAFDFMSVWVPRGSCTRIPGSEEMSVTNWRQSFVTKHAKGSHVEWSSLISSIRLRMCLHKQKGILIDRAYKNWALFKTSSLLRVVGNRLCKIIFPGSRCGGEKAPILMWAWAHSLMSAKKCIFGPLNLH